MESSIVLSVQFKEESKLMEVNSETTFSQLQTRILGTWPLLKLEFLSIHFTVGDITNCLMDSDVDLRNLVLICQHSSQKIVHVDIYYTVANGDSCSAASTIGNEHNHILGDLHSVLGETNSLSNNEKKVRYRGADDEFCGFGEMPTYDISPFEISKSYLSDYWCNIMEDGVGVEIDGGAIE
ncbi:hypothetical protein ACS0TY_013632 [Phlomoides rotata]